MITALLLCVVAQADVRPGTLLPESELHDRTSIVGSTAGLGFDPDKGRNYVMYLISGGGYGGTAYLYTNQGGGSDVPPNGGGVGLPGGYGPNYRGVWQGPVVPTRGGLSGGGH